MTISIVQVAYSKTNLRIIPTFNWHLKPSVSIMGSISIRSLLLRAVLKEKIYYLGPNKDPIPTPYLIVVPKQNSSSIN